MTAKQRYQNLRDHGYSDEDIALEFGVKLSTVKRAIGSNKNEKKENKDMNTDMGFYDDFEDEDVEESTASTNDGVLHLIVKKCIDCGKEFDVTPAEQKFYMNKGYEIPKRCGDCRKKRNEYEEKVCVDCGATFQFRKTEKEYFEKNNLYFPIRCPKCREYKRKHNEVKRQAENN